MKQEPNINLKKEYGVIAFFLSFLIGIVYTWLFTWKEIGVSHIIFFVFFEVIALLPIIFVEKENIGKRINLWLIVGIIFSLVSLLFIYRINIFWGVIAFLTIPLINTVFLTATVFPETLANVGIFSIITLPFKFLIAWFVDFFNYFKNLDFSFIKSSKIQSIINRVLLGLFFGFLVLLIIVPLLSFADQVFGKYVSDFFVNTFGDWFKDFNSTVQTIGKFIVGFCVAIYSSVFLFSIWNKESYLQKLMSDNLSSKIKEFTRNWDVIVVSVLIFTINLVFVLFVFVQFKYFFGGENNILGVDANYIYSEYARKGFGELVAVSIIIYIIALFVSSKVYLANLLQKVIFKLNLVVLIVLTLIIAYAAYARLDLLQEVYGFTGIRFLGFLGIAFIGLTYIFLLISIFLKSSWNFNNKSIVMLLVITYVILLMTPSDYIIARLNVDRYYRTDKIDLAYLFSLENEALPVLIELSKSEQISQESKTVIYSHLESRWQDMKEGRKNWQSFNFTDTYLRNELQGIFDGKESTYYRQESRDLLNAKLKEYSDLMVQGKYEEAYKEYWSKNSQPLDFEGIRKIDLTEYKIAEDVNIDSLISFTSTRYWNGTRVPVELRFYQDGKYFSEMCGSDTLTISLEDGEWKIINAEQLILANFKDGGNQGANFYQNKDYSHLEYLGYYCN